MKTKEIEEEKKNNDENLSTRVLQTFEPAKITVSSESAGMKLKNSINQSHNINSSTK
jgi:hypothetical protein